MTVGLSKWLALAACCIACLGWARSRTLLRHEAIILCAVLVYFFIGTLDLIVDSGEWSPRVDVTQRVWQVVALGTWGYLIGAWLGRWRGRRIGERAGTAPARRLVADSLKLEVVGWVGLALLLIIYRAPALTGSDREIESGYLTSVAQLLLAAYLVRFAAERAAPPRGVWLRAVLAGLGLLVSGYRSYTLVLWLGLLVLWFVQPRSVWQRVRALALGSGVLLTVGIGFGYLRFLREGTDSGWDLVNSVFESDAVTPAQLVAGFTYVSFFREGPSLLGFMVERYPHIEPYKGGQAMWGMVTSPLPGKQLDARAILSKEVYGIAQTSLVSTIFGPWYLDFGYAGVFVGLLLIGAIVSRLEAGALRYGRPAAQAGYAYGLVITGLSIHTGLSDFTFAILLPAVLLWAGRSGAAVPGGPQGESSQDHEQHAGDERGIA